MTSSSVRIINPLERKFKTLEQLVRIANAARRKGEIVVAKNGSYDILHPGHSRTLQESKAQGDILIVGLDSNKSIKRRKGKGRPINNASYRAEMLAALECVDYLTWIDDSVEFVKAIKPDVYTNGPEYGENCIEAEHVRQYGGRVHINKKYKAFSTSGLIAKIRGSKCL